MFKQANVTVMVSDFDRAVRFYSETLGLHLKFRHGNEWAELRAPGINIGLHAAGKQGPQAGAPGGLSIGLEVDRLDEAMAALKEKGVRFAPKISEDGPVRIAHFSDEDGNPLYLVEQKSSQTAQGWTKTQ